MSASATEAAIMISSVLMATGYVNAEWQFTAHYRIDTRQPIIKQFVAGDYVGDPNSRDIFGGHPPTGWASRRMVKYNRLVAHFIYAFYSETHLQVRLIEGYSRLMAQTTWTHARMCLF